MSFSRLAAEPAKHTVHYLFGTPRNILLGAGLSYAIEREEYTHLPLIFFFPSIYAGYHAHRNKDVMMDWIIESKKKLGRGWLWR
jgi:hypothetical protein